ncbi:MAG: hypothetical protein ABSE77_20395 [Acidimicrobiales bacterium]|jgi:hypothetical protein
MSVHPLEHLRYLARGWGSGDDFPAREAAEVLADLATESPGTLVHACRRLIEYFPSSGQAWWLGARALCAPDPPEGIRDASGELAGDPTVRRLAEALPVPAAVAFPDASGAIRAALRRRQEVQVQKKAARAQLVVVSALAAGPGAVLTGARSVAAASTAAGAGKPVWAVVGRGVLLPGPLWEQLLERAGAGADAAVGVIEAAKLEAVVSDQGLAAPLPALSRPTCPPVAELLGWKS